jgi:hypothetical protein
MVIYEPYYDKRKKISPTTSEIELNTAFSSKSGAISEIEHASKSIESQLRGNFAPMVTFHPNNPYGNESTSFSKIISYPYVREYVIPDEGLRNCYSLNEYFKRLDIARIKCDKNKS